MNQKGIGLFVLIGIAFVVIALLPPIVMAFFPAADIVMRVILVLIIFMTVRGYLGNGILSLVVSGILIYFLVIKYAYITASVYILYILSSFAFLSMIVWGSFAMRPK